MGSLNNKEMAAKLLVLEREAYDLVNRIHNLVREVLDTEEVEE